VEINYWRDLAWIDLVIAMGAVVCYLVAPST